MRKLLPLLALVLAAVAAGVWLGHSRSATDRADAKAAPAAALRASAADRAPADAASPTDTNPSIAATNAAPRAPYQANPVEAARSMVSPPPRVSDARPPPPRPQSPTENHLLGAYGLRAEDQQTLMVSPRFDKVVDALAREGSSDSLQMTRLYRAQLDAAMKADKRFSLDRMECGAHLCVATAIGAANLDDDINALVTPAPKGPKLYAVLAASLAQPGNSGLSEYRLMFTTDPAFNSIEISAPRP
jgi:hypothetical protein